MNYEKRIWELKLLRKVYDVLKFGDFCTDYEGCPQKLGDTVNMRPTPELFGPVYQSIPLCLSIALPYPIDDGMNLIRAIMDNVVWSSKGYVVVAWIEPGEYIMGWRSL